MYFIEEFAKLRICLFRCVFCRNLAKRVIFIQFLHYCCQRWSPWAIFIARLYWFCLIRTGDVLFGSNLSKFRSKNLKASLMSLTCTLFSDKGRCFNQSKRALYGNFIIILWKLHPLCKPDSFEKHVISLKGLQFSTYLMFLWCCY